MRRRSPAVSSGTWRRSWSSGRAARRSSAPSAASRSRRSTSGSPGTRPARRGRTRASRCSSATRRTSSRRTSARRSRRTSSPRGRRLSSRSPVCCGLGTLKAADEANIWGIGVDVDQYALAGNVLTSGIKRVDEGVFQFVKAVKTGAPLGTGNLTFDLANGGMGLGRTSPQVPKAIIASTKCSSSGSSTASTRRRWSSSSDSHVSRRRAGASPPFVFLPAPSAP